MTTEKCSIARDYLTISAHLMIGVYKVLKHDYPMLAGDLADLVKLLVNIINRID